MLSRSMMMLPLILNFFFLSACSDKENLTHQKQITPTVSVYSEAPSSTQVPENLNSTTNIVQEELFVFAPGANEWMEIPNVLQPERYNELLAPAEQIYNVSLFSDSTRIWVNAWCAETEELLVNNLKHITFNLYLNEESIPSEQILVYSPPSRPCQILITAITNWPTYKSTTLRYVRQHDMDINDGVRTYSKGSYIEEIEVKASAPPPLVKFPSLNAHESIPEDVLKEVSYFPAGGGERGDCLGNSPLEPIILDYPKVTDVSIGQRFYVLTCGWQANERVKISLESPDGSLLTEYHWHQIFDQGAGSIPLGVSFEKTVDVTDIPGTYRLIFEGESGKVEQEITVRETVYPKLLDEPDGRILLYNFQPYETVRLIGYSWSDPARGNVVEFSEWEEYTVDEKGTLLIELQVDYQKLGVIGELSGDVGDVSIQVSQASQIQPTPVPQPSPTPVPQSTLVFEDRAQSSENIDIVSQMAGEISQLVFDGQKGYVAAGPRIAVFDFSQPTNPVFLGKSEILPGLVSDIKVWENIALVTVEWSSFYLLDLTDPENINMIGRISSGIDDWAYHDFRENFLYLITRDEQQSVQVLDISDPSNPESVNELNLSDASAMRLSDNLLFIINPVDGLKVFDVSDPYDLQEVPFNADSLPQGFRIDIIENVLLIITDQGIEFFDIEDFDAPVFLAKIENPNHWYFHQNWSISPDKRFLLLHLYDISAITSPPDWLRIFDISEPGSPMEIIPFRELSHLGNLSFATHEGFLYTTTNWSSETFEISRFDNSGNLIKVGGFRAIESVSQVLFEQNIAFAVSGYNGLGVFDFSDIENPNLLSHISLPGNTKDIAVNEGIAFLVGSESGLRSFDISNPIKVQEVGRFNIMNLGEVAISEPGELYILAGGPRTPNVRVVQLDASGQFTETMMISNSYASDLVVSSNLLFVPSSVSGLVILDNETKEFVSQVSSGESVECVAIFDRFAYVGDSQGNVKIVDISNPVNPIEVSIIKSDQNLSGVNAISITNNKLYIAFGHYLWIGDLTDPLMPREVGFFEAPSEINHISFFQDEIVLSVGSGGVYILSLHE